MFTRRRFLRFVAGLGATGLTTAAYGVGVEPLFRLRVARYHVRPPHWPSDLQLTVAAIASVIPGCR